MSDSQAELVTPTPAPQPPEESGAVRQRWASAPDPRFNPDDYELLADLCVDLYIRGYRTVRKMKECLDRCVERGVFINREDRIVLSFMPIAGEGGFSMKLIAYLFEIARQKVYYDKLNIETPEEAMRHDLNVIDHVESIAWRKITELENSLDKDDVRGLFKGLQTILASQERRAKLLGLDSTTLVVTPRSSESVAGRIIAATLARTKRKTVAYGPDEEPEGPDDTALSMLKERNLDDEDEEEPHDDTNPDNAGGEAKALNPVEEGALPNAPGTP